MDDEIEVDRRRSRYGLHMVRVLRAGRPVDRDRWIQAAMEAGADPNSILIWESREEAIGMHYLTVWWRETQYMGGRYAWSQ